MPDALYQLPLPVAGVLIITLIVGFDRPFHGDLGIDPEPYRLIRRQLMTP